MSHMDTASFRHTWARFEAWLAVHSPADHAALREPAKPEQLASLESRLGFALHPELKALLELHDGAAEPVAGPGSRVALPAGAFLPSGHRLSSVDSIVMAYNVLVGVGEDNFEADLWEEDALAVNLDRCVPFALPNDGGVAFIDHRPGPSYGYVYEMGIGSGDLDGTLWATSLSELFQALTTALETSGPFLYYVPTTYAHESGHHCVEWEIRH
ncbi:SMI1/KNR4 family protein [Streptomyces sp. NPDC057854]|uniref:SMI1/KNR4 family protein n=1 Tax=unclassified Streptomyces TaxID=2593676 RepID=UPI003678DE2B